MIILIDKGANEILSVFDIIKSKLNELIIHGAERYNPVNFLDIKDLKEKLKSLHLTLIAECLKEFLESLERNDNAKTSTSVLKIISITRMFESIMNIELIKKDLINWMDQINAKSRN